MDDNLSDNASRPTDTNTPGHEIDSSENFETQSSSLNTEELTKKTTYKPVCCVGTFYQWTCIGFI
jgi:hypothetical protein